MNLEFPFHSIYLVYAFLMTIYRSYYNGYVDASLERVSRIEEGRSMLYFRSIFGLFFMGGALLYMMNPIWMRWSQFPYTPLWVRWFGVVMLLLSLWIYGWTHRHLGRNFTDTVYVRKESTLVTTGPYYWVRHPMYVSGLLAAIGTGLTLANWFLGILGTVLMLVIMYVRTPIEEKKLLDKHGELYRQYMRTTGRFIPRL